MVSLKTPDEGEGYPVIDLCTAEIDPSVAKVIPSRLVLHYQVVPIRQDGTKLVVAMVDPTNVFAQEDMRLITGFEIVPGKLSREQFDAYKAKNYPDAKTEELSTGLENLLKEAGVLQEAVNHDEVTKEVASIIRMVNVLFQNAFKQDATAMNIVPYGRQLLVTYKIDGVWREVMTLPKFAHAPLLSRIKIMAEMNIAERRLPQTSHVTLRHEKQDYWINIEVLPTIYGESAHIFLYKQKALTKLEGINQTATKRLRNLLQTNKGVIICFASVWPEQHKLLHPLLYMIQRDAVRTIKIKDPENPDGPPIETETGTRNLVLVQEQNIGAVLPEIQAIYTNPKAGLRLDMLARKLCSLDFDVVAFDGIDISSAETLLNATNRLVIIAMSASSLEDVVEQFVHKFQIEPKLLAHAVKAVLGQVKGDASISFDLAPTIKTMNL